MSTFNLLPTDLRVPCQSFQCYERAAYTLGKSDAPRGTEYIICEQCANELIENIAKTVIFEDNSVEIVDNVPFEDGPEETVSEAKLQDLNVAVLKSIAEDKGITGISKKTKAELIELIESHE